MASRLWEKAYEAGKSGQTAERLDVTSAHKPRLAILIRSETSAPKNSKPRCLAEGFEVGILVGWGQREGRMALSNWLRKGPLGSDVEAFAAPFVRGTQSSMF